MIAPETTSVAQTIRSVVQPPNDLAELKKKSVRGGMVTMLSQGISIAIQLASTVVLSRLLSPDDYGVMAMVMAVTGFAGLFRDLGLSSAAIQKKDLTRAQQSNLFWLNVAMGTLLTALVAAASPLVAWFYGKPELTAVTLALSASFLIGSLGTQHGAMLVRTLRFGRQAVANISGALLGLAVSIAFALHGHSYWSLVWGNLVGGLATTLFLFALSPFRPGIPAKGTGIRDMLKFGANVTAFDVINFFHRNADNILLGKFSGSDQLGLYSRAYSLLMLPITTIRNPLLAVAFPALSSLHDSPKDFRAYYLKLTKIIGFFCMPLAALCFLCSSQIIRLVLGDRWQASATIFSILAGVSFVQPVGTMWAVITVASGHPKRYLLLGALNACVTVCSFAIGLKWGAIGVATGYLVATLLVTYPLLHISFRNTAIRISDFHSAVFQPAFASLLALGLCGVVEYWCYGLSSLSQLTILTIIFGVSYLALLAWIPGGRELIFGVYSLRNLTN